MMSRLAKGMAQLVEDDEVEARQLIGEPPLSATAHLGLQAVDEIDHVVEAAAGATADAAAGDRDGQVGFAGTGASDQDGIALLRKEAAVG